MSCRTLEFSKGRRREIVKIGGFRLGRQDERTKRKLGGTQQHDPMIILADQCGRIAEFANGFIHVPCSSQLVTSRPPSGVRYAWSRRTAWTTTEIHVHQATSSRPKSEERRVGNEGDSTCKNRWWQH